MSTTNNSTSFNQFDFSDFFLAGVSKGNLYPLGIIEEESIETINGSGLEVQLKILQELKDRVTNHGSTILNDMPLPKRFTKEQINHQWSKVVNNYFNKMEKKVQHNRESGYFNVLITTLELKRRIETRIKNKNYVNLNQVITSYKQQLEQTFINIIDLLFSLRTVYNLIYLEANLPAEFSLCINNVLNAIITYIQFLQLEIEDIIKNLRRFKSGRRTIKDSKSIIITIAELDKLHNKVFANFNKLILFMEVWNTKSIDDVFINSSTYCITNFDNYQDFFINSLNQLLNFGNNFHQRVVLAALEREKMIPFALREGLSEEEEETRSLFARIVHST